MTIYQALKTKKPLRRKNHVFKTRPPQDPAFWGVVSCVAPKTWIEPLYLVLEIKLTLEDLTATDWEVLRK